MQFASAKFQVLTINTQEVIRLNRLPPLIKHAIFLVKSSSNSPKIVLNANISFFSVQPCFWCLQLLLTAANKKKWPYRGPFLPFTGCNFSHKTNQGKPWWHCIATPPQQSPVDSLWQTYHRDRTKVSERASDWSIYSNKRSWKKVKNFLMHQTKKRKQPKGIAVSGNEARGSGVKSRVGIDFDKLREAGWTISEMQSSSGDKVLFRYVNASGKTIKSSRNVEKQLREEGT